MTSLLFLFLLHPLTNASGWLTVCCVYFGLQGDVGLPGPSGTPGDGSLRSEQTLTIYKGDKVTQQGKARSRRCSAFTTHTHAHTHMDVVGFHYKRGKKVDNRQQAVCCLKLTRKKSSDCSKLYSRGGEDVLAQRSEESKEEETLGRGGGEVDPTEHQYFPDTLEFVAQDVVQGELLWRQK